jgi:protein translocase SecG subunit
MSILYIALGVVGAILIIVILLQSGTTGLSATFGGSTDFIATKRGPEKFLHRATIVLVIAFMILAFLVPFWENLVILFKTRFGA